MRKLLDFAVAATAVVIVIGSASSMGVGPAFAGDTQFTDVTDLDTFKARFMGPKIMDPKDGANYFIIKDGGVIEGSWFGKTMAGEWRWEDKFSAARCLLHAQPLKIAKSGATLKVKHVL